MGTVTWPRQTRIGAAADYLLGVPVKIIEQKWGVPQCTVGYWVKRAGFKLRRPKRSRRK